MHEWDGFLTHAGRLPPMNRYALPLLAVSICGVLLGYACTPPPPKPIDSGSFPTASTSAKPLYISTEPTASSSASGSATVSPPPVPVSSDLPAEASLQLADRTASCARPSCWRTGLVPKPGETQQPALSASPDLGIAPPVALWQEHLGAKERLDFPRAKGFGLLGVVLHGVVSVVPAEGGKLAALQSWGAFVAPGVGVALAADKAGADVLLVAYADEGSLGDKVADLRAHEKNYFWGKRAAPLVVTDLQRQPDLAWAHGEAHARMAFTREQSPRAYLGTMILGPNLPVAAHEHKDSWEILLPLQASGALEFSGAGLSQERGPFPKDVPVRPGTVVMAPAGAQHAWKPDETGPLVAIQLFVPPGPEERYTKLAGAPAAGK